MTTTTDRSANHDALLDAYRLVPTAPAGALFATLYVPTPSAVDDAEHRLDIRTQNAGRALTEAGAGDDLVAAATAALAEAEHDEGEALALVVTADGVCLRRPLIRPVARLAVQVAPTPALLPLLAATRADVPHLAVLLDRVGADLWVRHDLGQAVLTEVVEGDDEHIHRSQPGGWSQRRFQQRAENTWERNAREVVDEMLDVVDEPIDLVIAGGDVRAVGFFTEHVPERLKPVTVVDGSRSADPGAFLDEVDRAVRTLAAERLVDEIGALRDAVGAGTAVAGDEALDLLGQGRIERLYVADDTFAPDRPTGAFDVTIPLWVGGGAAAEASTPERTTTAPLTDGAVVLASATGAEVVVLPGTGVAGLAAPVAGIVRG